VELKIEDVVVCIIGDGKYLMEGEMYVVERYAKPEYPNHSDIVLAGVPGCWSRKRFGLVCRPPDLSEQLKYLVDAKMLDLLDSMKYAARAGFPIEPEKTLTGTFVRYERQNHRSRDIIAPAPIQCAGCHKRTNTLNFQGGGCFDFPLAATGLPESAIDSGEEQALCPTCAEEVARFIKHLATRHDGYDPDVD
jgi:hypothetical protein